MVCRLAGDCEIPTAVMRFSLTVEQVRYLVAIWLPAQCESAAFLWLAGGEGAYAMHSLAGLQWKLTCDMPGTSHIGLSRVTKLDMLGSRSMGVVDGIHGNGTY